MSIGYTVFETSSLAKTRGKLSLLSTTRPIADLNGMASAFTVWVDTDKLILVFLSRFVDLECYNRVMVIVMTKMKRPYF